MCLIGEVVYAARSMFLPDLIFACTTDPPVWLTHLPGPAVGCGLLTPNYPAHIRLNLISGVPAAESCEEKIVLVGNGICGHTQTPTGNPCFGMTFEVPESCPSPCLLAAFEFVKYLKLALNSTPSCLRLLRLTQGVCHHALLHEGLERGQQLERRTEGVWFLSSPD